MLVHLGSPNFLERFKMYVAHVQEWRTQFQRLESVDLRYEQQVIVNPDSAGRGSQGWSHLPRGSEKRGQYAARHRRPRKKSSAAKQGEEALDQPWEVKPKTCYGD